MRNKILELLRNLEKECLYKNEYDDFNEQFNCDYKVEEILHFPNFRFVFDKYNQLHSPNELSIPSNSIKSELKRMELDGLVTIDTQIGIKNATTESNLEPDYDENNEFTTESIILTTMGKSKWKYYYHKMIENPFTVLIAITSLIISIISLLK